MEKRIKLSLSVDCCVWLLKLLDSLSFSFSHFPQPELNIIRSNLRYELLERGYDV